MNISEHISLSSNLSDLYAEYIRSLQWERRTIRYVSASLGTLLIIACTFWNVFNLVLLMKFTRWTLFYKYMRSFHIINQLFNITYLWMIYASDTFGIVPRIQTRYGCQILEFTTLFSWSLLYHMIVVISLERLYLVLLKRHNAISSWLMNFMIVCGIIISGLIALPIAKNTGRLIRSYVYMLPSYSIMLKNHHHTAATCNHSRVYTCETLSIEWAIFRARFTIGLSLLAPCIFIISAISLIVIRCRGRTKLKNHTKSNRRKEVRMLTAQFITGLLVLIQAAPMFILQKQLSRFNVNHYRTRPWFFIKYKFGMDVFQYLTGSCSTLVAASMVLTSSSYKTLLFKAASNPVKVLLA